jgi:hypothetical protein
VAVEFRRVGVESRRVGTRSSKKQLPGPSPTPAGSVLKSGGSIPSDVTGSCIRCVRTATAREAFHRGYKRRISLGRDRTRRLSNNWRVGHAEHASRIDLGRPADVIAT